MGYTIRRLVVLLPDWLYYCPLGSHLLWYWENPAVTMVTKVACMSTDAWTGHLWWLGLLIYCVNNKIAGDQSKYWNICQYYRRHHQPISQRNYELIIEILKKKSCCSYLKNIDLLRWKFCTHHNSWKFPHTKTTQMCWYVQNFILIAPVS